MKHKILTFFLACLVPWLAGAQQSANSQNNVAEKDYIAYLFTYFTGNHISEEAVCYAVSTDGYTYWDSRWRILPEPQRSIQDRLHNC